MPRFNSRKEYQKTLDELETSLNPKLFNLFNTNFWPVIKVQIGYIFHLDFANQLNFEQKSVSEVNVTLKQKFRLTLNLLYRFIKLHLLKYNVNTNDSDILVLGYKSHNISFKNTEFNVYTTPFLSILETLGKSAKYLQFDNTNKTKYEKLYQEYHNFFFIYQTLAFNLKAISSAKNLAAKVS